MNVSAHSGVGNLSFGAIALDLVSTVGLYGSKSKGRRNIFVFHFQVKGLVFALGTNISGDSSFHPAFQKGRFPTF